jgi:hypothetical protein
MPRPMPTTADTERQTILAIRLYASQKKPSGLVACRLLYSISRKLRSVICAQKIAAKA